MNFKEEYDKKCKELEDLMTESIEFDFRNIFDDFYTATIKNLEEIQLKYAEIVVLKAKMDGMYDDI